MSHNLEFSGHQSSLGEDWKPNLFIAGFAKCGTTEFCDYLSQHPSIFLPYQKEPNSFYDLESYPAYFSGDVTGKKRHSAMKHEEYQRLYEKGIRHRYRIDATVSYSFHSKFARQLKDFSRNSKSILLIRDQEQRLVSMYLFSFILHRKEDFENWIDDYFEPHLRSYLYYDKVVSFCDAFGDDCRVIETQHMSSANVHSLVFKYLSLDPVSINIRHKNANLLAPTDSMMYRNMIMPLASMKLMCFRLSKIFGLESQFLKSSYRMGDFVRDVSRRNSSRTDYSRLTNSIPIHIRTELKEDYANTLEFAKKKGLLIAP